MGRIPNAKSERPELLGMVKPGSQIDAPDTHAPTIDGARKAPEAQHAQAAAGLRGFTVYDLMLLGMIVIWAANPSAIKVALRSMDPLVFNAIRFALATLLPVGLLLASKEPVRWQHGDGP